MLAWVAFLVGLDKVLKSIYGLSLFWNIIRLVQGLLNGFDDLWTTNISQNFEVKGNTLRLGDSILPLNFFVGLVLALLKAHSHPGYEFIGIFGLAEGAIQGVRVAGLLELGIDASAIVTVTEGQQGSGVNVRVVLNAGVVGEELESKMVSLTWASKHIN